MARRKKRSDSRGYVTREVQSIAARTRVELRLLRDPCGILLRTLMPATTYLVGKRNSGTTTYTIDPTYL